MRPLGTDFYRDIGQSMMEYLPKYYQSSKTVNEIIKTDAKELEKLNADIEDVLKQFFVKTATWGLDIWESELGMEIDRKNNYEIRRANIIAKLQAPGTFTLEAATQMANSFTKNGTANIVENFSDYSFKIYLDSDDVVDIGNMIKTINIYKPAHLGQIPVLKSEHKNNVIHFINSRLKLRSSINFWNENVIRINGEYMLNGSILLNSEYSNIDRHNARLRIKTFNTNNNKKIIDGSLRIINNYWLLDGKYMLDGSKKLDPYKKEVTL